MKKFRLLFSMLAATAVLFTACNPDNGGNTPPPAEPTEIGFFGDVNLGTGNMYEPGMDLTMAVGLPGHWVKITCENVQATLFMLDFSGDPLQYAYLKEGFYPIVAGSFENMQWPTVSSLVAMEPDFCNFYVYSEDMIYTPVVPATEADAEGNPYGVTVVASPATTGMDMSYLEFNVPVVDQNGKSAVVKGYYCGPIGYNNLGGGGGSQTAPFDLNEFGFSNFEATYNAGANLLSLVGQSMMGNFRFNFNLSETDGVWVGQAFDCVEGGGALSGFFWDAMADVDYTIDSGRVVVEATETPGEYLLVVSSRNPVVLWSNALTYEMAGEFTVTVTGLPDNLK